MLRINKEFFFGIPLESLANSEFRNSCFLFRFLTDLHVSQAAHHPANLAQQLPSALIEHEMQLAITDD